MQVELKLPTWSIQQGKKDQIVSAWAQKHILLYQNLFKVHDVP
jgi:hypothetical protein